MKGISHFIALLMILTVVIGVGIGLVLYLPRFIGSQEPRGGELMIMQVSVDSYGSRRTLENLNPKHRIEVLIRMIYQGSERVEIKRVYAQYNIVPGNIYIIGEPETITVEFNIIGPKVLSPNTYSKLFGMAYGPMPPEKIDLNIEYCFPSENRCETTTIHTTVNYHYTS